MFEGTEPDCHKNSCQGICQRRANGGSDPPLPSLLTNPREVGGLVRPILLMRKAKLSEIQCFRTT